MNISKELKADWLPKLQVRYWGAIVKAKVAHSEYHRQVPPPENRLNCQGAHVLEALTYCHRYISTATALFLLIWVRRFRCRRCRISVSEEMDSGKTKGAESFEGLT